MIYDGGELQRLCVERAEALRLVSELRARNVVLQNIIFEMKTKLEAYGTSDDLESLDHDGGSGSTA